MYLQTFYAFHLAFSSHSLFGYYIPAFCLASILNILSRILSATHLHSHFLFGNLSDILFWHSGWHLFYFILALHCAILSRIRSGMFFAILFWHPSCIQSNILSAWGTAETQPQAPNLSRQCPRLTLAVQTWRCPL